MNVISLDKYRLFKSVNKSINSNTYDVFKMHNSKVKVSNTDNIMINNILNKFKLYNLKYNIEYMEEKNNRIYIISLSISNIDPLYDISLGFIKYKQSEPDNLHIYKVHNNKSINIKIDELEESLFNMISKTTIKETIKHWRKLGIDMVDNKNYIKEDGKIKSKITETEYRYMCDLVKNKFTNIIDENIMGNIIEYNLESMLKLFVSEYKFDYDIDISINSKGHSESIVLIHMKQPIYLKIDISIEPNIIIKISYMDINNNMIINDAFTEEDFYKCQEKILFILNNHMNNIETHITNN